MRCRMADNQDQQYYQDQDQQYHGQEGETSSWEGAGEENGGQYYPGDPNGGQYYQDGGDQNGAQYYQGDGGDPNGGQFYQGDGASAQSYENGTETTHAEWGQQQEGQWAPQQEEGQWAQPQQEGQWAQQQEGEWAQPGQEGQWTEGAAEAQGYYGSDMAEGNEGNGYGYDREADPMAARYRLDDAATKIQGVFRQRQAKIEAQARAEWQYKQMYDAVERRYRYMNRRTGSLHDVRPRLLAPVEDINPVAMRGLVRLQATMRRKLAKKAIMQRKKQVFTKHFDPETGMPFYMDKRSMVTTWVKPPGLGVDEVEFTDEDAYLVNKDREIRELKAALEAKDRELSTLMRKKTEEVEVMLRRQRIDKARAEGADKRTQEMDLWSVDEVMAWFVEQGLPDYEESLYKNRVDGFLLVHLDNNDWADLGISNRVHIKRLNMLLDPYRIRFRAREAAKKAQEAEKDALQNVVGVSGLLALHEDDLGEELGEALGDKTKKAADLGRNKETTGLGLSSTMAATLESEEEEPLPPTAEELEELRKDQLNITLEALHPGGAARAEKGEVVSIHYSCYVEATGQLVESSRTHRHRPFEFVLGFGQVIKGLDRSLGLVGIGSRSKITVRAPYAYGDEGLPPLIPPNARLIFDVEVLSARTRPAWEKPVIQHPGLSERLFYERPEDESEYERYIRGLQQAIAELKAVAAQQADEEDDDQGEPEAGLLAKEPEEMQASVASSVTT